MVSSPATVPTNDSEFLRVAWDGKTPKLKDMPQDPVIVAKASGVEQSYLLAPLDLTFERGALGNGLTVLRCHRPGQQVRIAMPGRIGFQYFS